MALEGEEKQGKWSDTDIFDARTPVKLGDP